METLNLGASTPRTESRLKALFWPAIQNSSDVDYLGVQGYWVCCVVAFASLCLLAASGHAIAGILVFLFFYLGGVGVRERSRYAAIVVLLVYAVDMLSSPGVVRILLTALLLSNLRATWIASQWRPDSDEAILPPRLGDSWSDRFADILPQWLWPKVRILYYVFSAGVILAVFVGLAMQMTVLHVTNGEQ